MAQVIIEFGAAPALSLNGAATIMDVTGAQSEEITSTGTSQATTMTANNGDACTVTNNGAEDVWVTFGSSPTAAVAATHFVAANTTRDFGNLRSGYKCAVINDS